jgi:hypothetical protein
MRQRGAASNPLNDAGAGAAGLRSRDPRVLAIASAIVALIDAFAHDGRALGAGRVAAQSAASDTYYTSRKGGPYIPGKSRAWMLRHARTIPGARKIGRDWVIKASDFEAYLVQRDIDRVKGMAGNEATNNTIEALVQEAMRINRMRSHGGT